MKRFLKGAALGLTFAGLASIFTYFNGFNQQSLTVLLYLYILLGVISSLKSALMDYGGLKDLLHSIVIVVEGEEMKLKKLFTGEKYRVDGDIEKL